MVLTNRSWRGVAAGLVVAAIVAGAAGTAAAQDPTVAPATTLSADGRTVSGAGRSLSASQVQGMASAGQSVTVSGAGYDVQKGVYIALCVIPPTNQPPSPCGGGQDITGSSGASAWISSNPPDYAGGLAQPYGAGGTFSVTIGIGAAISPGLDCLMVRCAIVTRNDHTRGSDRSQDLFIPVTFAPPVSQPPSTTPTTPPPVVTTTTVTTTTLPPAPSTTLAADGRTVSNGAQQLAVSAVADLDPTGASIAVEGTGFDPAAGIYVALCRIPEPGQAPGPCTAGEGQAAWVASNPPDFGVGVAEPFDDGGTFEVELEVGAVIDDTTDCREVPCAVATRRDDTAATDRTLDLLVPVAFADAATTTTTEASGEAAAAPTATTSGGDSGGSGTAVAIAAVVLVAAAVGGTVAVRRRRSAA